jgi:hypothetical protein
MKAFEIRPLIGIGPVRFGMTRHEVRKVLGKPRDTRAAHTFASIEFPDADYFFENSFQITYDTQGTVDFIELATDDRFVGTYEGVDLLRMDANEAVDRVARNAAIDESDSEYPTSYVFPDLEMSLWRECLPEDDPDGIEGRRFKAVGLGRVGYFSARPRASGG